MLRSCRALAAAIPDDPAPTMQTVGSFDMRLSPLSGEEAYRGDAGVMFVARR